MHVGQYATVTPQEMDIALHKFAKKKFGREMKVSFEVNGAGFLSLHLMLEYAQDAVTFAEIYAAYDEEGYDFTLDECNFAPSFTTYPHIIATRILAEFFKDEFLFKAKELIYKDGMFIFLDSVL